MVVLLTIIFATHFRHFLTQLLIDGYYSVSRKLSLVNFQSGAKLNGHYQGTCSIRDCVFILGVDIGC